MRLPMLRKASGEIDIGEWRGTIFGPKAVRLGIGDDLAGGRDKADAGWMVDRFQDRRKVDQFDPIDNNAAEARRGLLAVLEVADHAIITGKGFEPFLDFLFLIEKLY